MPSQHLRGQEPGHSHHPAPHPEPKAAPALLASLLHHPFPAAEGGASGKKDHCSFKGTIGKERVQTAPFGNFVAQGEDGELGNKRLSASLMFILVREVAILK